MYVCSEIFVGIIICRDYGVLRFNTINKKIQSAQRPAGVVQSSFSFLSLTASIQQIQFIAKTTERTNAVGLVRFFQGFIFVLPERWKSINIRI